MNTKLRAAVVGGLIAGAAALTVSAAGTASAGPRHFMMKEPGVTQTAPAQSVNTPTTITAR